LRRSNTNFWFSIISLVVSLSILFGGLLFTCALLGIAFMAPEGTPAGEKIQLALNNLIHQQFLALLLAIAWLLGGVIISVSSLRNRVSCCRRNKGAELKTERTGTEREE